MSKQTFCANCGQSWWRAALTAMIIDAGARSTMDPNYCPESDDHEHRWNDYRDTAALKEQDE